MGTDGMFFFSNGKLEELKKVGDDGVDKALSVDWYLDSIMVFEGDYTNPDNKHEMLDVVLGLYADGSRLTHPSTTFLIWQVHMYREVHRHTLSL